MTASGVTPIRALPYPQGVDPIDVAGDVRLLATALDDGPGRTPAKLFPSKAALDAGTTGWPDGSLAMVAPGVLWIKIGGLWRLFEALPVQQVSVPISGSNVGQGLNTLTGQFTMLSSTTPRLWNVFWEYAFSGHTLSSVYRTRIVRLSDNSPMAISGYGSYHANEPFTGSHMSSFYKFANSPNESFGFQLEIGTQFANTNVNGGAIIQGVATEVTNPP